MPVEGAAEQNILASILADLFFFWVLASRLRPVVCCMNIFRIKAHGFILSWAVIQVLRCVNLTQPRDFGSWGCCDGAFWSPQLPSTAVVGTVATVGRPITGD